MKKEIKGFIAGALSVSLLSAGVSYAAGWLENISVVKNSTTISANYKPVNADNFIYNDTTYVPLRAVTESLGCTVDWNDETRDIAIYNTPLGFAKLTSYAMQYWDFIERKNNYIRSMNDRLNNLFENALMHELDDKNIRNFENDLEDLKNTFLDMADDYHQEKNDLRCLAEGDYLETVDENTIPNIFNSICDQFVDISVALEALKTFNSYDKKTRLQLYLADDNIATKCTYLINSTYERYYTIDTDIKNIRNLLYDYVRSL